MDRIEHYADLVFRQSNYFVGSNGMVVLVRLTGSRSGELIRVSPNSVNEWLRRDIARLPNCSDFNSLTNDRFYGDLLEARSFYCNGDNGIIRGEHTHSYPEDRDESGRELSYNELPPSAKSDVDIWRHIDTQIMGKDYEKYGLYTPANSNATNLRLEKLEDEVKSSQGLNKKEVESVIESYHGDDIERIESKFSKHTKNHNGGGFDLGGLFGGMSIGAIAALGLGLYIVTRSKSK